MPAGTTVDLGSQYVLASQAQEDFDDNDAVLRASSRRIDSSRRVVESEEPNLHGRRRFPRLPGDVPEVFGSSTTSCGRSVVSMEKLRARRGPIVVALLLGVAGDLPRRRRGQAAPRGDEALAAGRLSDAEAALLEEVPRSPLHPLLPPRPRRRPPSSEQGSGEFSLTGAAPALSRWRCRNMLLHSHRHPDDPGTLERVPGHGAAHGRECAPTLWTPLDRLALCTAERAGGAAAAAEALRRTVAIEDLVDRPRWLASTVRPDGELAGTRDNGVCPRDRTIAAGRPPRGRGRSPPTWSTCSALTELAHQQPPGGPALTAATEQVIELRVEVLADRLRVTQVFRGMPHEPRKDTAGKHRYTACNGVAIEEGRPDLADLLQLCSRRSWPRSTSPCGASDGTMEVRSRPTHWPAPEACPALDVAGDDDPLGAVFGCARCWSNLSQSPSDRATASWSRLTASTASDAGQRAGTAWTFRVFQDQTELTRYELEPRIVIPGGADDALVPEVPAGRRPTARPATPSPFKRSRRQAPSESSAEFAIVE